MNDNEPIDLNRLDADLLRDLEQQVNDGLITQAEAKALAEMIKPANK